MRSRFGNSVIAALFMLQLVIGMQWQLAHSNMALPEGLANGVQHCPGQLSKGSSTEGTRGAAGASTSVPSSHNNADRHDCCGSLDCQCHSAQGPGALDLSLPSVVGSTSFLLPVFDARAPVARMNELFRPPIA